MEREDGKVGGQKKFQLKKKKKRDFSFPHLCLVRRVEKWRDEKLLCSVENKVYKFTIMSLLNKTKINTLYFKKIAYRWTLY